MLIEENDGKAAIAVKRRNLNLLRDSQKSTRWILVVLGRILFLSMYLPHTWRGEENVEECYKTLKDLSKNMQDVKQEYQISGIIAGMDAQVEVNLNQGPFVGEGTRMSRGNKARYHEVENRCVSLLFEWVVKHLVKLANTFFKNSEPTRAKTNKLDFWQQDEAQLQKWKIMDYVAVLTEWMTRSTVARNCRAQNLADHRPLMTKVRTPCQKES